MSNFKSGYDFMKTLVETVSPKYFEGISIDDHRLSTFGYINEGFGLLLDSTTVNAVIQSNNLLLISADREHLLKNSFGSGDSYDLFATPAKQDYLIGIPRSVIITDENKNNIEVNYTLEDFSIDYDGLTYTLDNRIIITATNNYNGTFNFSSRLEDASDVITPHLFTIRDTIDGSIYILIRVTMNQTAKNVIKKPLLDIDLSLKNIEVGFTDQVSKIKAQYKVPTGTPIELEVHNKYSIINTSEKYVTYYIDEVAKIIRIELDSFDPEYNSELTITVYETKGILGNFTNTSPIVSVINNDFMYATPISDSKGGKDVVDTETLRENIIRNTASLNSLDNDKDLNNEFSKLNTSSLIANTFKKKRDDFITMEYSCYGLFRDKNYKYPMPTNTLNVKFADGQEDLYHATSRRKIFLPGTPLSLINGELRLLEKNTADTTDIQIAAAEADNNKLMYGLPFLTIVSESPDIVGYYLNSIKKDISSEVEFDNSGVDYQFICNKINITRDAITSNNYTITANIISNSDVPDGLLVDGVLTDPSKLVGVIYVYDEENNIIGYKKMTISSYNKDTKYFTLNADISTDDYINEEDELRVLNMIAPGLSVESSIMVKGSSGKLGLAIYVEDINLSKGSYVDIIPSMDQYSISNVYAFNDVDFFISMNMINTGITLTNETGTDYINLTDVPVIKYSYLKANILDIAEIITNYVDVIYDMSGFLNENIDVKFYNTYGRSRYIKSDGNVVTNVNTDLVIKIFFRDFVTDAYKAMIKKAISDLIDENNGFIISKQFSTLMAQFQLEAIELISMTGVSNIYKDVMLEDLDFTTATSEDIREYVPEKFVIMPDRITIQSVVKQ